MFFIVELLLILFVKQPPLSLVYYSYCNTWTANIFCGVFFLFAVSSFEGGDGDESSVDIYDGLDSTPVVSSMLFALLWSFFFWFYSLELDDTDISPSHPRQA